MGSQNIILAPYSWRTGVISKEDVLDKKTFEWEHPDQHSVPILKIWPDHQRSVEAMDGLVVKKNSTDK